MDAVCSMLYTCLPGLNLFEVGWNFSLLSALHSHICHANIYSVKRALLIPLRYLLLLLLFTALVTAYSVLEGLAIYENLGGESATPVILVQIISGLKTGLYLGGMFATIFAIRFILVMEKHRGLGLLFLFLVSAPVFFFGYYGIRQVERANFEGDRVLLSDLQPHTILRFPTGALYFSEAQPTSLDGVILYHHSNFVANRLNEEDERFAVLQLDPSVNRLDYFNRVMYDSDSGELLFNQRSAYTPGGRSLVINTSDMENTRSALFNRTGLLVNLRRDGSSLFRILDEYADEMSFRYVALILSMILFLFSTWVFLRLTRWPLVNMIMALLVNLGGLLLTRVGELSFIRNLAEGFLQERAFGYIGPAILTFFALLFLIINIFLPSVKSWAQEVGA